MSFFAKKLSTLRPLLKTHNDFNSSRAKFEKSPTAENFESVCEWVALIVSPDDNNELDGYFSGCLSQTVVSHFFYLALTEEILNVKGYLRRYISSSDANLRDWIHYRPLLRRSGVPTKAGNHLNR